MTESFDEIWHLKGRLVLNRRRNLCIYGLLANQVGQKYAPKGYEYAVS